MEELLKFIRFTQAYNEIARIIYRSPKNQKESDPEHSYQLGLVAWYINEKEKLGLDVGKFLRYAIVHDLVEAYAGDTTPGYGEETEGTKTKHEREKASLARIRQEFPEAAAIWGWIDEYEKRADEESKFLYALDKIIPILNMIVSGEREWDEYQVTLEMVIREKKEKVRHYPIIEKYFWELVELLRASGKIKEK